MSYPTISKGHLDFSFDTVNYPKFCLFQSSTDFEAIRRGSLSLSDWLKWMSQPFVVPGARANHSARSNLKMVGEKASMAHYPSQARPLPSLISKLPFLQLPSSLLPLLHPPTLLLPSSFLLFVLVSYLFLSFLTRGIKHLTTISSGSAEASYRSDLPYTASRT